MFVRPCDRVRSFFISDASSFAERNGSFVMERCPELVTGEGSSLLPSTTSSLLSSSFPVIHNAQSPRSIRILQNSNLVRPERRSVSFGTRRNWRPSFQFNFLHLGRISLKHNNSMYLEKRAKQSDVCNGFQFNFLDLDRIFRICITAQSIGKKERDETI